VAELQGFMPPRSPRGRASIVPPPPWHYSGDVLTIEYRTDPAAVAELLPDPLEPADEDPGAVAVVFADWQSCSDTFEELLDPLRAQYKEAFVVVRCRYFPSIERGAAPSMNELVTMKGYHVEGSPVWGGHATLEFHDSPVAELTRIAPREMIGGYYRSVGMSWDGGTLLDPP